MKEATARSDSQTVWTIDPAHSTVEFSVKSFFFFIVKRDRDTLRITGALTIKEKSREVVLDADKLDHSRSPDGEEVSYYNASTEFDRFDFGIAHSRGLIGRSLKVMINVQAIRHST